MQALPGLPIVCVGKLRSKGYTSPASHPQLPVVPAFNINTDDSLTVALSSEQFP